MPMPNNSKQHDALAKTWRHAGGARDLQSATMFLESCHSVALAKDCFGKAAPFFAKKISAAILFGAANTEIFESKKWSFLVFKLYCIFFVQTSHVAKETKGPAK
jgi:hypothetical protein